MLYVTTRIHADAFTVYHALTENRGPGGGLYLPMRLHACSEKQIASLGEKTFGQNVADVMNLLFNTRLSGTEVELFIGRHPVKLVGLGNKVHIAQLWRNPNSKFEWLEQNLAKAVLNTEKPAMVSDWMRIGIRIGMLFGIYGEMVRCGILKTGEELDVAAPSGDFAAVMAAFYAGKLGLPIGTIVVSCNENNGLWSLFHLGEVKTSAPVQQTKLPKCDHGLPVGLERLIFSTLGAEQTEFFLHSCTLGGNYRLSDFQMRRLSEGFYVSVVSQHRTEKMISGIYGSSGYIPDPYTTLAWCGLMDYRVGKGESGPGLILAEESPLWEPEMVCKSLGITMGELKERIDRS